MVQYEFAQFKVGDTVAVGRAFSQDDIEQFSRLSGDRNPLHVDAEYAAATPFEKTVVPMQLLLAPVSMFAGMVFPGRPSLLLGQEVKALRPVFAGESLVYSAQITDISHSARVLTVRVLAIRGDEVMLDVQFRSQARYDVWEQEAMLPVRNSVAPGRALITGGSGELGFAIGVELAKRGWKLLLQDRGTEERRNHIAARLEKYGCMPEFLAADFEVEAEQDDFARAIARRDDVSLVFHAASTTISSGLRALVATNYTAMRKITQALLPGFLARQNGTVVFLSSLSLEQTAAGMDEYAAAKAMGGNYVNGLDRSYGSYGVHGLAALLGMVRTRFSRQLSGHDEAMLPGQAAEGVVAFSLAPGRTGNCLLLTNSRNAVGRFGFNRAAPVDAALRDNFPKGKPKPTLGAGDSAAKPANLPRLESVVKNILQYDGSLADAALGITPGWDSLRHIEMILAIEREFGMKLTSEEMSTMDNFAALSALVQRRD